MTDFKFNEDKGPVQNNFTKTSFIEKFLIKTGITKDKKTSQLLSLILVVLMFIFTFVMFLNIFSDETNKSINKTNKTLWDETI